MALSNRGQEMARPSPVGDIWEILQNQWDPAENRDGYVSLGVAENTLMHDRLTAHINKNMALPNHSLTYGDGPTGGRRTKAALARFLTRRLKPRIPITPENITVTNGCTAAIEHLSLSLADPGDIFLLGRPYYRAFIDDIEQRMSAKLVTVSFGDIDPFSVAAVKRYEDELVAAQSRGQRVAAVIIAHPHNPLGRCYPHDTLVELMKLCQKYQVHLLSDEIYALSAFKNNVDHNTAVVPFESTLAIDTDKIMDPALLHVLWGMSKDFGANGIRLGALISQHNPALHKSIIPAALYSSASSISEHATANILEDDAWVDGYIKENQDKLGENYAHVAMWARDQGIEYVRGVTAAFFLWLNLGSAYRKNHPQASDQDDITETVTKALSEQKVFIASGEGFGSEKPGWFRLVFAHERTNLDEGLRRIAAALAQ